MTRRDFPPIHPGEILLKEFLEPLGMSEYRLAKDIAVAPRRINEIVHGRRAVIPPTRPFVLGVSSAWRHSSGLIFSLITIWRWQWISCRTALKKRFSPSRGQPEFRCILDRSKPSHPIIWVAAHVHDGINHYRNFREFA